MLLSVVGCLTGSTFPFLNFEKKDFFSFTSSSDFSIFSSGFSFFTAFFFAVFFFAVFLAAFFFGFSSMISSSGSSLFLLTQFLSFSFSEPNMVF